MTLLISGCMPSYLLNLGVESNIVKVEDSPKIYFWSPELECLTLIFKVKPLFFKFILFSRSVIIDTFFISNFLSFSTSN